MRVDSSWNRTKPDQERVVDITADDLRAECAFMLGKIVQPIEVHEASKKAIDRKAAKLVGLGVRRAEKLRLGQVNEPKGREYKKIRVAFEQWRAQQRAKALLTLQENEAEHEDHTHAAADFSSASWQRAFGAGSPSGAMGPGSAGSSR